MEELRNLALQLGKMGLLKVTLEADLNEFLELKKSAIRYMSLGSPLGNTLYAPEDKLEFLLQIHGVKMLIVCRNAKLETLS